MLNELINYLDCRQLGLNAFFDICNNTIVVCENNYSDSTRFVKIPSREDLFPYRKAIEVYSFKHNFEIPDYKKSIWLRERGLYDDFRAFYDDIVKNELKDWYIAHCTVKFVKSKS